MESIASAPWLQTRFKATVQEERNEMTDRRKRKDGTFKMKVLLGSLTNDGVVL